MRELIYTGQFKRDFKKIKAQGKSITNLQNVISLLLEDATIPKSYKDHALKGHWVNCRDLHIDPDWVLIYRKMGDAELILERTGSHSEIFK